MGSLGMLFGSLVLSAPLLTLGGTPRSKCEGETCATHAGSLIQRTAGKRSVDKLASYYDEKFGPHPPVQQDNHDFDVWAKTVVDETQPVLLDLGSKWGVSAPAEIYPSSRFRMFARNPMVVLSEARAVVCYDDMRNSGTAGYGTCSVLAIEGDNVTEKGLDFALQLNRNGHRRADAVNLWKLSETSFVACFGASGEDSWDWYGTCKKLSVADKTISQDGDTFHFADKAKFANLKPLPGSSTRAVVCYNLVEVAIGMMFDQTSVTYCKVISVESGGFQAGEAVQVNDGDSKQFVELTVLSETTAVVCIDDGMDNSSRGFREPLHGRGASGFCVKLAIDGSGLTKVGQLQVATGETQIDSLVALTDTSAVLCLSTNTASPPSWGICSLLTVPVNGEMVLGPPTKPETCWSGSGVANSIELLPIGDNKVLACYTTYSRGKCVNLSVGADSELSLDDADKFNVASGDVYLDDFHMVPYGQDKALACFASASARYGDASGACAVINPALTGPAQDAAAPIIQPPTPPPTPSPTYAPRRRHRATQPPAAPQVSDTWTVTGNGCVLDVDDCVASDTSTDTSTDTSKGVEYEKSQGCTIKPNREVRITFNDIFATESGYDKLTVVGKASMEGIVKPDDIALSTEDTITWSSDSSVQKAGWKFCVKAD